MGQYRGETLVVVVDGYFRMGLAPTGLLDTSQILARLSIRLPRLADDDTFHLLTLQIRLQPVEKL